LKEKGLGLPKLYSRSNEFLSTQPLTLELVPIGYLQRRVFTAVLLGGYYTKIGCIHIICNVYRVLSRRICLAV
jgi:hypothetical protein